MKYKFSSYHGIPEVIQNYVNENFPEKDRTNLEGNARSMFGFRGKISEVPLEDVNRLANEWQAKLEAGEL